MQMRVWQHDGDEPTTMIALDAASFARFWAGWRDAALAANPDCAANFPHRRRPLEPDPNRGNSAAGVLRRGSCNHLGLTTTRGIGGATPRSHPKNWGWQTSRYCATCICRGDVAAMR